MSSSQELNGLAANGSRSLSDIRTSISALSPEIRKQWHQPLRDHARSVYTIAEIEQCNPIRQDARRRLLCMVEKAALRSGYTLDEALEARDQLANVPVLQTGPHCHLLIEPDAFYTHHFSLLGLQDRGLRWYHWYSCSTVKLIESAHKGPGWMRVGGGVVNLFGLSRRRMDERSVCGAHREPVRFGLAATADTRPKAEAIQALAKMLPGGEFASAADAIRTANIDLWKNSMGGDTRLLQLDDFDVADLVADHLGDPSSWLGTHLFATDGFAETLLKCLALLDDGPWQGWIRRTTDLFWGLFNGRLLPLRLAGGALRSACGRAECGIDRRSLAAALLDRRVVPSLLMTFLVLSILPGVRVLGGCRQIVYYPLMRHVIVAALNRCGFYPLRTDMDDDRSLGTWGHRVLKPVDGNPMIEIQTTDVRERLAIYGSRSLKEACGDMGSFTRDPLWADLGRHLAAGTISSKSPELRGWQPR